MRAACEQAEVPMPRMKAVLRALDDAGITIDVPAGPAAKRAVAATTSARRRRRPRPPTSKPAKPRSTAKPARRAATAKPPTPPPAPPGPPRPRRPPRPAKPGPADAAAGGDGRPPTTAIAVEDIAASPTPRRSSTRPSSRSRTSAEPPRSLATPRSRPAEAEVARGRRVETAEGPPPAAEEEDAFVLTDDDDDAPAQQVATAGATADPVKDYLKQIGKVALLNAEQEVELAKRIEAGLFAEEKLNSGDKLDAKLRARAASGSPRTAAAPRTTCSRPTCAWSSRWPSATPAAACSSWT